MRIISWNVNGYRAVLKKGFDEAFDAFNADIVCLQESKMQQGQAEVEKQGYHLYMHSAEKKGYSGTMVFTKIKPLNVFYEMDTLDTHEGRVITLEFESFFLVNAYVPNAQDELKRIDFRETFEDHMRAHLKKLDAQKPVLYCGDLNVARNPIDLKRPKQNEGQPGYSEQERAKLELLLKENFADTFRHFYPTKEDAYTWWSYRANARANNVGWRIDYFIASERLLPQLKDAFILADVFGSDHCPVGVDLND